MKGAAAVMPLHDVNLDLWHFEQGRRAAAVDQRDIAAATSSGRLVTGLRVRLGQALIAGGEAIGGRAVRDRAARREPSRPVSAHR